MINGPDTDLKAETLVKAYKAIDHEDNTRVILLALHTHAPTPEGKAYIRGEILKYEGDQLGMKSVADSILRKLLLPVIALGTKSHVSPSARTEIKQLALSRDNYRCVVSKAVELSYFYTPETVEWNPGDQWLPTYASHVIPLAKSTKSSSWQALERFAGFRLDELYGDRISNLTNIITLTYDIHSAFCRFLVWFELDKKTPKPNVYRFRKQLPSLPGPPDGTIVRLSTTDPDLPTPHLKYILLHAALAKVLRDSDMGRWVDGMLREDGTLIDYTSGVLGAWDQFGKDYPFLNIEEVLKSPYVNTIDILRHWLRLDNEEKLNEEVIRFESEVIRHGVLKAGQTEERPGWTIVTSSSRWYAPRALESVGIPPPKHMVVAEDVEHGKPSPDPYLQAAKNCKVDPNNCLVIEDSISGMRAGRAAGAKVLGVCTSGPRSKIEKGEPDYIVENLTRVSLPIVRRALRRRPLFKPKQTKVLGPALPAQHHDTMSLHSSSAYKYWGDDEDEDSMAAVKWISPEPNAVLVSGNKLVATWSTPARPVASPSFQLCLVETEECGDTVWPKVKKLSNGQYTITLKVPQLGSANDFFVRMIDDKGSVYDTPDFKLQGSSSAGHQESNEYGSTNPPLSSSGSEGEIKGRPRPSNEGVDRTTPNNTGKGSGSTINGTAAVSISRNSTVAAATSSQALAPSVTNNALISSFHDNKPSTAAIVVPLAIFAAALAGLLFSLRQRSKAKEIRGSKNESTLNRVTSKDSCASGSTMGGSASSRTDLERAMEFIARVKAPQSPQLTPLPPSIESRWRERREIRMREFDGPVPAEVSHERRSMSVSSSMPNVDQWDRQRDGPLPPIPRVAELEPRYTYPEPEIPRSTSYPVIQSHPPVPSQATVYRPPAPATVKDVAYIPTHPLDPCSGNYPNAPEATYVMPNAHLPASRSLTGMPRPPDVVQPQVYILPPSTSQPSIATGLIHSTSATLAPISDSAFHPPTILPGSLQATTLPRPPMLPVPDIAINTGYSEPQPQYQHEYQHEYQPTDQSPTRPCPAIPYSTRPQTAKPVINAILNPYDAIARALRTPRLG
ncbi:Arginine-glutamic acid dipeptide repeats protein [Rhizoctonia solani]|uniref:Arginine-glutamic acid dipeptide repeats protein n=1 Tax=Rhizoctonia solani TaxID=456999 RepID=A0A0K6G264_9AGAM|nr:Arginine-glutamic acid dipeptide repeats protein [Rhizoctonia solani]